MSINKYVFIFFCKYIYIYMYIYTYIYMNAYIGYDHTVDWWAIGVLLFHFLAGVTPFMGDSQVYIHILIYICIYI
jgi:serine/threonine protein kinase